MMLSPGRGDTAEGRAGVQGGVDLAAWPGPLNRLLHGALRVCVALAFRVLFRLRVEGNPPPPGACVLVANHTSYLDPLVLGAAAGRRVVFLMTEVVYRSRWGGWFYRWSRAIPLSVRRPNREPLRAAREVLRQGRALAVFPEGGISRDGLPLLGNPGAVSLVLGEQVPVVPVGLSGVSDVLPPGARWPRRRRMTVRFGAPLAPAELADPGAGRRERLRQATSLIMQRIADLSGLESREAALARLRREAAEA